MATCLGRMLLAVAAILALAAFAAGPSTAQIVTFEDFSGTARPNDIYTSITSAGYEFASVHEHFVNQPASFGGITNGTAYISEEAGGLGLPITMTRAGGGTFTLNALDGGPPFVSAPADYPNATQIYVVGRKDGGGQVSTTLALSGAPAFQNFALQGLDSVTSVTFYGNSASNTGGIALDNIVVNALPTKDQCKNDGWKNFPQFKNQGQCVGFVERG
jgi:hypothetical protein